MSRIKKLVFLAIFAAQLSFAQETTPPPSNEFLAPNEVNPELAIPIMKKASRGAYLAVGTERGLMQAAMSDGTTHIYLVDREAGTVLFNQINVELIRAASLPGLSLTERRNRYLFLRLAGTFEDWQTAVGDFDFITHKRNFDWFTKAARGRSFLDFNSPPKPSYLAAFRNANYMYDDVAYGKVEAFALERKIDCIQLNFGSHDAAFNREGVQKLLNQLEQEKIPISVFDLSNAWSRKYLGPKWTAELQKTLAASSAASPNSIFIVTDYHRSQFYKNGERAKAPWFSVQATAYETNSHYEYDWTYHGYSFQYLNDHPLFNLLNSSLPKGTSLNGSLLDCDLPLKR